MRVKSLILLFFLSIVSCKTEKIKNNFNCEDEVACFEFEKKLKLVHDWNFLLGKNYGKELMQAGAFLDSITGFETTADISHSGLNPPTIEDYENWSIWYSTNYNCLRYSKKDSVLSIDKECVKINKEKYE